MPEFFEMRYDSKAFKVFAAVIIFVFVALSYIFATINITIIVNIMSFSRVIVSVCFIGPYLWVANIK